LLIHQDSPESSPKQARQSLHVQHMQMSVWTWGKNCNYLLGHPSSDDWSIPERVELPVGQKAGKLCMASLSTLSHHMPSIRKVVMSKYHSCVLTEQGLLYICGFGSGGRLGLGHEETAMDFRLVPLSPQKVSDVALGADHTVITTFEGTVLTWGSNTYGQLGIFSLSLQCRIY
jgi:alpha-tubulin suppressor-like RCC1 family protein